MPRVQYATYTRFNPSGPRKPQRSPIPVHQVQDVQRCHKSLKTEYIRPQTPLSLDDARRIVGQFVARYNEIRLHSAIGFVTPKNKLEGRDAEIFAARDRKLEAARAERKVRRQAAQERQFPLWSPPAFVPPLKGARGMLKPTCISSPFEGG